MEARHLKNITINSYRGLKDVHLANLNSINILTGKNNSGKTSVLEVINTLRDPLNAESWFQPAYTRQAGISIYTEFQRMFPFGENKIEYSFVGVAENVENHVMLSENIAETMVTWNELNRQNGYTKNTPNAQDDVPVPMKQLQISMKFNSNSNSLRVLEHQTALNAENNGGVYIPTVYLPPSAHSLNLGKLIEPVFKKKSNYERVLKALKRLDENITGINLINNEIFIHSSKFDEAIPLASYGDGLKRTMVIAAYVALAQNGIVLIDEFETSIHRSAIEETFREIINMAEDNNVQLVMTSHNEQAIISVLGIENDILDKTNVYTLYEKDNIIRTRRMTGEEALDASSWGVSL